MVERKKRKVRARDDGGDQGRSKVLRCPFCKGIPGVPADVPTPFGDEVEGGHCECGAVYVYDRSGRKLGEAFTEALVMAFEWDYDAAFAAPEGSYEEAVIRFNPRVGQFLDGEGSYKDRSGRFYFVRRKKPE